MSTRVLSKEQFSNFTTIDGSRVDLVLQNIQDRYNSPEFRDIDMWVENKFAYGYTPPAFYNNIDSWRQGAPFTWAYQSKMPTPIPNYDQPNNRFRFKGAGLVDPVTGVPIFKSTDYYDLSWFWTVTQYFTKPTIIQDFVVTGLFDERTDDNIDVNSKWFGGTWRYSSGGNILFDNQFSLYICVDNAQNVGDTFIRNSEVHLWASSAESYTMNPYGLVTRSYSDQQYVYNPTLPSATVHKINGNAVRITGINLPVFAGSRVRFVFALPAHGTDLFSSSPTDDTGRGGYGWEPSDPLNEVSSDRRTLTQTTFGNNIWCVNIATLEPLEKVRNE